MKKNTIIIIFTAFVLCVWAVFVAYERNTDNGFWRTTDFATYLSGIFAPITALGMIYITYMVYKLNEDRYQSEVYFSKIVELYFKIEDSYSHLERTTDKQGAEDYANEIKMYAVLLRRYLILFSKKSHLVRNMNNVLTLIHIVPECKEFHMRLTENFETFCLYSEYSSFDKSRTLRLKKNKNGIFEEEY